MLPVDCRLSAGLRESNRLSGRLVAVLSSESRRDLVLAESLPELWFRKDSSSVETFGEGVGERRPTDCKRMRTVVSHSHTTWTATPSHATYPACTTARHHDLCYQGGLLGA